MRRPSGFSLLELMVAVLLMGLLLAGMLQVYLASLDSWTRVNEGLALRRTLRLALDRIAEDLRMVGHLVPPAAMRALELAPGDDPQAQGGFMLVPGETADELSFVLDVPVPVPAELGSAIPEPAPEGAPGPAAPCTLQLRADRAMGLESGDLLLVAGDRCECARVEGPAELSPGRAGSVPVVRADRAGGPVFRHPHGAGAPVLAVRPLRLVRYAVVRMDLGPGRRRRGRDAGEPCLVRFETAYPPDRAAPRWERLLAAAHGREGGHEVVAEHVAGFRVDYAPDGRFPGIRGSSRADTAGNLEARLQALHGRAEAATRDPLWFHAAGGLVSVRLELRGPGSRRCPGAGETQVVAPRNFGL